MEKWTHKLLDWYERNKRDLPWRYTSDPYKIWLSEVILQQTRVNQGMDYYLRFIEKYPTVSKLASATEHEVLKLWQGLGYYSRARNMLTAAHHIKNKMNGKFPTSYDDIRSLKGIGDYTAAAIASFAFGLPYAVVDGNVMRVYSRFLGISKPVNSNKGKKMIWEAAVNFLPKNDPGQFNQAIMELGALVCLPRKPLCSDCPLQSECYAYSHKLTDKLPVKARKAVKKERILNYLIIQVGKEIVIRKRAGNDIWKGLYDFPCIETPGAVSASDLKNTKEWKEIFGRNKAGIRSVSAEFNHILTHRRIRARFYKVNTDKQMKKLEKHCSWVPLNKLDNYPIPRLIERYISAKL